MYLPPAPVLFFGLVATVVLLAITVIVYERMLAAERAERRRAEDERDQAQGLQRSRESDPRRDALLRNANR